MLSEQVLSRLVACAMADRLDEPGMGLTQVEVSSFAPLMQLKWNLWSSLLMSLNTEQLIALARFLTLAEERLTGWQSGANSPVIAIAKVLRAENSWPDDLTEWVRENSTNRFIPHGSLMDRL